MVQLVSPCCGAPADYQYATWHRCRACGGSFEQAQDAPRVVFGAMAGPMSFNVYPSHAHASRGFKVELSGGDEGPEPKALL